MRFADPFTRTQEDTRKAKTQTTSQTVEVRADGEGLVSHAGAFLLVELADRLGLTAGLSEAMAPTRKRRSAHDPGVVLRDLAAAVADGGDCLADLGVLRGQEEALLRWSALLCLKRELAVAEPKRVRQRLLHVAGQMVRSGRRTILRLPRSWPPWRCYLPKVARSHPAG